MLGLGLVRGMGRTLRYFFSKKITQMYPEERPNLAPRVRGPIKLTPSKCIACSICAQVCPVQTITVTARRDPETRKRRLVRFSVDYGRCIYCGFCVENCPTNAIVNSQEFELATFWRESLHRQLYPVPAEQEVGRTEPAQESGVSVS